MKKFWNFIRNDTGERILRLEGPIDEDNFWGDEVTPKAFREELEADEGDVTVYINSPGGNVFAAAQIYTMLLEHKGKVTVKIDAIAASAASVIAMAGETVLMSPVAMLMIHDPMTIAMGNAKDMEEAINTLNEVKESIINAYHLKSGLNRKKISQLMEDQTWMNAKKAVELGFADGIIARGASEAVESEEENEDGKEIEAVWQPYSTRAMGQRVLNRLVSSAEIPAGTDEEPVEAEGDEADVESPETGVKPVEDTVPGQPGPVEDKEPEGDPDEEEESEEEDDPGEGPGEESEDDPEKTTKPKAADTGPVIGLDGKTKDGAMPYDLLIKQLEYLR
jgi:ATP-dependent Clp protease protease subunit